MIQLSIFLSTSNDDFDVVTFNSVLHHLYDPISVVRAVAGRIRPGGFFYSNFDMPRPSSPALNKLFLDLDIIAAKFSSDRKDFLPGAMRRFRKLFVRKNEAHGKPVITVGDLAEYHARSGLDDSSLVAALQQLGFAVDIQRYRVSRTWVVRSLNRVIPAVLNFRIRAQRV
jgi:SAM-dependent methyltransferase